MLARFCHYLLLPILAACLGNACNKENGEERQAVVVTVTANAPGYDADQVDDLVATPVATRLIGIPGVQRIRSRATAGRAVLWVDYAPGTNVYKTRQVTAGGLQLADPALPETVDLMLGQVLVPDQVMLVALSGRRPISELREVADWVVRLPSADDARRGRSSRDGRAGHAVSNNCLSGHDEGLFLDDL